MWEEVGIYKILSVVFEFLIEIFSYLDWIVKKFFFVVFDIVVELVCIFFDIKYEEM